MIFADPPRNIGYNQTGASDTLLPEIYHLFIERWIAEATRCLQRDGRLIICLSPNVRFTHERIARNYLAFEQEIIWHYDFGVYTKKQYVPSHDNILIFRKGNPKFNWQSVSILSQRQKVKDVRADPRGRTPGSVWAIPRTTGNSKQRFFLHTSGHSGQSCQPEELCRRLILGYTEPRHTCLDLFSGSGSFKLAALGLKRTVFSMDISQFYMENVKARLTGEPEREFKEL